MAYSVIARDATDEQALERRMAVRDEHLEGIKPHVESGVLQFAGAFLDENGVMRGSIMVLDLPDEAAVRTHLMADVYSRTGVWQDFEIRQFRRVV